MNNRIKHWALQKRDEKGRFLSYDGTGGKRYTVADIEKAFMAGYSEHSSIFSTPAKKLELYKKANNIF